MNNIPDGCMEFESEGHLYHLRPVWTGRYFETRVAFAEMWDDEGTFIGLWDRADMHLKLIRQLEHQARWLQQLGFKSNGLNIQPPLIMDAPES